MTALDRTAAGGRSEAVDGLIDGIPAAVHRRRWLILAVLTLSLVLVVIAVSSLNVAIPKIQTDLGASFTQMQWVVDAYALVFAGLLLPAGALGDRFGRKGALQLGLAIFGIGTAVASRVSDPAQLIAARTVLGVGAAFIMPATLSIIVNSFPIHERPKAIAVWAAFAGVGGALGPISSGLLLDHFWWGSIFFVNLPLVVTLLVLSALYVPTSKDPHGHPLDPVGGLLSVVGLVAVVYAVIEGPDNGWTAPVTLATFAVGVIALAAFVAFEGRAEHPMLDPRLFRVKGFASGSASITLGFFNMFAMFFLITQYLQFVKGYSPLGAGLRILPNALTMLVVAPQGPRLVTRFGVRKVVRTGFLLAGGGFLLLSTLGASSSSVLVLLALVLTGMGVALVMPTSSQQIVGSLPLAKAGVGSAVNDVTREVGGALGIAVVGSIASSLYRSHAHFAGSATTPALRARARSSVGQAIGVAHEQLGSGSFTRQQFAAFVHAAGRAFANGTHMAFLVIACVAVAAGALIGWWMPDELPTRVIPSSPAAPPA